MLERVLADARWAAEAVPYAELRGFLFAVLNGPEAIPVDEWLPEVFGGAEPDFESPAQRQSVMDALMALETASAALLAEEPAGLPDGVVFREPPLANFDDGAPAAAWARGFVRGYGWIEESWDGVAEDFGSVIAALGFFSSRAFAAAVFETTPNQLGELAAATIELFADAAVEYQRIGRSVAALDEEDTP